VFAARENNGRTDDGVNALFLCEESNDDQEPRRPELGRAGGAKTSRKKPGEKMFRG